MAKKKPQEKQRGRIEVTPQMRRWLGGIMMGLGVAIALSVALKNPTVGIAVGIGVGTILSLNLSGKR